MVLTEDKFIRNEYKEIIIYVALVGLLAIFLPLWVGFALEGFSESFIPGRPFTINDLLAQYQIYYIFVVASFLLIIFPIARLIWIRRNEHPATQKNPTFMRIFTVSMIFAPEENGLLYWASEKLGFSGKRNFMRWSKSILRVFVVGTLIFATFGMLQAVAPELQVAAIPQLIVQQVTFTSQMTFAVEPMSTSETYTLGFILFLLMGINAYVVAKFQLGKATYFGLGFIISLLMGGGWMGFHRIVYGNDEASLFATFIFGFMGAFLTILFGTIFIWYIWHFWNNFFVKIRELVTINEDIIVIGAVSIFTLLILWISTELIIRRLRKKRTGAGS